MYGIPSRRQETGSLGRTDTRHGGKGNRFEAKRVEPVVNQSSFHIKSQRIAVVGDPPKYVEHHLFFDFVVSSVPFT